MDEQLQLAFEFAVEIAKELIALASGILALSLTFSRDIIKSPSKFQRILLAAAWILYFLSILAGISVLMGITGDLVPRFGPRTPVNGISEDVRWMAAAQISIFALATVIFTFTGIHFLVKFKEELPSNPGASPPRQAKPASRNRQR